jgi:hypothetical protein
MKAPKELLSVHYLMHLHPELSYSEAKHLYIFCWDNSIRHVECYGSGSIMYSLWKESKLKNMNKKIEMSLESARQMYKEGNETTNKWLLENFTKEELERKKGFTWEESYNGKGFYITGNSDIVKWNSTIGHTHKNVFLTEKHAKSALAFAQLSHIVNKYNVGKEMGEYRHTIYSYRKHIHTATNDGYSHQLEFYALEDAKTSMEVNRQLWLDYWMID